MSDSRWLIYGATGFTGRLVVDEAVQRGHRPVLAGRSAGKLRSLAEMYGLDYVACELADSERLAEIVGEFDVVCHLAGPYIYTSEPMVRACLAASASYLDVAGEISVLEGMQAYAERAEEAGIALVAAAGFVATATDCCARYAADHLARPIRLELAIANLSSVSAGTAKSILEMLPDGIVVRKNGKLIRQGIGRGARHVAFLDKERPVIPAPQADLVTVFLATGVHDITTYVAVPKGTTPLIKMAGPLVQKLLAVPAVRHFFCGLIDRYLHGPDAADLRSARAYTWVRAEDRDGSVAEVWLDTIGPYPFTAHAVVSGVERILAERPVGLLTPAQVFGPDFVLEITGTERRVRLS